MYYGSLLPGEIDSNVVLPTFQGGFQDDQLELRCGARGSSEKSRARWRLLTDGCKGNVSIILKFEKRVEAEYLPTRKLKKRER